MNLTSVSFLLCSVLSVRAVAQSATPDRPISAMTQGAMDSLRRAMQPAIAQARATYPGARKRYLAGLASGYRFYVTTTLADSAGHIEQVFVSVDSIRKDQIFGRIASDIGNVQGYVANQPYSLPESSILDWLITDPNGAEEGNFVGKFIDAYQDSLRANSVGTVTFRFTSDSVFAVLGNFAGSVEVRADSLVVTVDSVTTTANTGNAAPVYDVWLRMALAYGAKSGDWAVAALSNSTLISAALAPGQHLETSKLRFALPRPKYQLAAFWLVFRYEAADSANEKTARKFTAYAHSDQAIFRRFM